MNDQELNDKLTSPKVVDALHDIVCKPDDDDMSVREFAVLCVAVVFVIAAYWFANLIFVGW